MKKAFLIIICLSIPHLIIAQDTAKQREVGIVISNLDYFGLTYKTGTAISLWRFQTMVLGGRHNITKGSDSVKTQGEFGCGVQLGKEFRTQIANKLDFKYGVDLSVRYGQVKNEFEYEYSNFHSRNTTEQISVSPGLNLILGFNYSFADNLLFGAELQPYISYSAGKKTENIYYYGENYETKLKNTTNEINGYSYGLNNNSIQLSLVYLF